MKGYMDMMSKFIGTVAVALGVCLAAFPSDEDGDMMLDSWEGSFNRPNIINPTVSDGDKDGDGDVWSNWSEARGGTDPTNPFDAPKPTISLHVTTPHGSEYQNLRMKMIVESQNASTSGTPTPYSVATYVADAYGVSRTNAIEITGKSLYALDFPMYSMGPNAVNDDSVSASIVRKVKGGTKVMALNYANGLFLTDNYIPLASIDLDTYVLTFNRERCRRFVASNDVIRIGWTSTGTRNPYDYTKSFYNTESGNMESGNLSFIAYLTPNEDYTYKPGYPLGCSVDQPIGFGANNVDLGMSVMNGISPRFNVDDSSVSDRSERGVYELPLGGKVWLGDRYHIYYYTNIVKFVDAEDVNAKVSIRRFLINDAIGDSLTDSTKIPSANHVVKEVTLGDKGRKFLYEADFLTDGELDIEWSTLRSQVIEDSGVEEAFNYNGANVTSMTYLAVLDGGAGYETWLRGSSSSNTVIQALATRIERRFEEVKHAPVARNVTAVSYAARPTFSWSLPNESDWVKKYGTSYTAFKLKIFDGATGAIVYDSGVRRAPAQDDQGYFNWTADVSVGDLTANGQFFSNTGSNTWQVAMYNAKFPPSSSWESDRPSAKAKFSVAVNAIQPMNDHGYSSIDATVKYLGSTEIDTSMTTNKNVLHAVAYQYPNFCGYGESRVSCTNADNISTTGASMRLVGLPDGYYYPFAWIDSNGNGKYDDGEHYGYQHDDDYNPKGVRILKTMSAPPKCTIEVRD